MFYKHRHFFCSKDHSGVWCLYAGYSCIGRFKKRYWADKARKHLQHLLDTFNFEILHHEIFLIRVNDSVFDVWHPDLEL